MKSKGNLSKGNLRFARQAGAQLRSEPALCPLNPSSCGVLKDNEMKRKDHKDARQA